MHVPQKEMDTQFFKSGQNQMAKEVISPGEDPTTIILPNGYNIKLPSN